MLVVYCPCRSEMPYWLRGNHMILSSTTSMEVKFRLISYMYPHKCDNNMNHVCIYVTSVACHWLHYHDHDHTHAYIYIIVSYWLKQLWTVLEDIWSYSGFIPRSVRKTSVVRWLSRKLLCIKRNPGMTQKLSNTCISVLLVIYCPTPFCSWVYMIYCCKMSRITYPDKKNHGPTLGTPGSCRPRWAPWWPHEPSYQG